jgi:transcriptional regulator of acetoin/glycerol metabolism
MRDVSTPHESRLLESPSSAATPQASNTVHYDDDHFEDVEDVVVPEESLSLEEREKELIIKALEKNRGKRKYAALELGISERTLYRKIKEFELG